VQARAAELGGAFTGGDHFNTREYRAGEFPFGNMFTDARSLARMYAATVSDVDGVRLLNPATVERMTVVQTDKTRMHGLPPGLTIRPIVRSTCRLGSGGPARRCLGLVPGSFGHPGSGGSVGFADPDSGVGFGYVTNLWSFRIGEPRASNLAAAIVSCLG
jgi:CubicO group peptidase (beta-lactamase class C family)